MIIVHEADDIVEVGCDAPGCAVRRYETRPLAGDPARATIARLVRQEGWDARAGGDGAPVHLCPDHLRAARLAASQKRFDAWLAKRRTEARIKAGLGRSAAP